MLYYTILHHTILYYAILYYTILYYTIGKNSWDESTSWDQPADKLIDACASAWDCFRHPN